MAAVTWASKKNQLFPKSTRINCSRRVWVVCSHGATIIRTNIKQIMATTTISNKSEHRGNLKLMLKKIMLQLSHRELVINSNGETLIWTATVSGVQRQLGHKSHRTMMKMTLSLSHRACSKDQILIKTIIQHSPHVNRSKALTQIHNDRIKSHAWWTQTIMLMKTRSCSLRGCRAMAIAAADGAQLARRNQITAIMSTLKKMKQRSRRECPTNRIAKASIH